VLVGVDVPVEVGVLPGVCVKVAVSVAGAGVLVNVAVGVPVDGIDSVGLAVGVGVSVNSGVSVLLTIVAVGVSVVIGVCDGVAVAGGVFVNVGVDVLAGVSVGVAVKVAVPVGPPSVSTTSCGGAVPSREEKVTPSGLSATKAKVYVPFPLTREVTSYSTHVFVPKAPLLSTAPLNSAGWVFQVTPPDPDSVQLLFARYTAGPFAVPFVVQNTRNLAL
jgi:hypothetical protein